jgi:hypothetical protein
MASPLVGVWELVSDDEKAILIFTETHLSGVFERTNTRRGIASTYTIDGNRLRVNRLVDTATNVNPQGEIEFQIEGETMTWTLLTPGTVSPVGHVDVWRKIE